MIDLASSSLGEPQDQAILHRNRARVKRILRELLDSIREVHRLVGDEARLMRLNGRWDAELGVLGHDGALESARVDAAVRDRSHLVLLFFERETRKKVTGLLCFYCDGH